MAKVAVTLGYFICAAVMAAALRVCEGNGIESLGVDIANVAMWAALVVGSVCALAWYREHSHA